MNEKHALMLAWQELCAAEQQCFGDSMTFHTVEPILRKFAAALREAVVPPPAWQPLDDILRELQKAATKFPTWPLRATDAALIVAEECGEFQRAVLQATYEGGSVEAVRKEAIQTAAMVFQFLLNLNDATDFRAGHQRSKVLPPLPASPAAAGTENR